MPTAYIAGMGLQGPAIAYGLHKLGFKVIGMEASAENAKASREFLEKLKVPAIIIEKNIFDSFPLSEEKPDVLVSSLPFNLNYRLACLCIEEGIRYCDLGGNVEISKLIRKKAEESAKAPVMTDLGLAPGIANIIAEIGYSELESCSFVKIRVGGLPVNPKGSLKYGMTFSPQGLYNEYKEECLILEEGKAKVVEPLTGVENLHFDGVGELEAFYTSGGISNTLDSMLARGVKECWYKTLRFPGHSALIRFLLFECGLSIEAFSEAMKNACGFIKEDQVLIDIELAGENSQWRRRFRILHDENFTAMQKTTGFGAAIVAAIIGEGKVDSLRAVNYAHIAGVGNEFKSYLSQLIPEITL